MSESEIQQQMEDRNSMYTGLLKLGVEFYIKHNCNLF